MFSDGHLICRYLSIWSICRRHHVAGVDMPTNAFRADVPFNELPRLPPAVYLDSRTILNACIPARAAFADLNAVRRSHPDPTILINPLRLLEARANSEIETSSPQPTDCFSSQPTLRPAPVPAQGSWRQESQSVYAGFVRLAAVPRPIPWPA